MVSQDMETFEGALFGQLDKVLQFHALVAPLLAPQLCDRVNGAQELAFKISTGFAWTRAQAHPQQKSLFSQTGTGVGWICPPRNLTILF